MASSSYNFENKRIGVIGGGSSAIQIIPALQKTKGATLDCFVRSRTWISRPFGDSAVAKLGLESLNCLFSAHFPVQDQKKLIAIVTPEQKMRFVNDPEHFLKFRSTIEVEANSVHSLTLKGSDLQTFARDDFMDLMRQRLAKKPEILKSLIPSFSVGCRRLTPGPGYLEALVEDNVNFIDTPICRCHPTGVELADGRSINLDVLVCATGFQASAPPPFPVCGRNGQTMQAKFEPYPETYISLATDGFPNYFMMLGPNAAIGTGSLTMMMEMEGDYIIKAIRKMQKEDIRSMEVKRQRVKDFSELVDTYFKRTVYLEGCSSWYRSNGGKGDRITGLWPGSALHAMETFRSPRWEDYDYVYEGESRAVEGNRLRWLGNGWSYAQSQIGGGDLAYYLQPEFTDVPASPFPEKSPTYQKRPFSY
jgi:cation diffusion facilitator CzcD-associated flavoprotein CzcO